MQLQPGEDILKIFEDIEDILNANATRRRSRKRIAKVAKHVKNESGLMENLREKKLITFNFDQQHLVKVAVSQ